MGKDLIETFATRLLALMDHNGMTIRGASDIAGVAKSTVQDWRSGVQPTDFGAVRKLAEALGSTLSFLLTGVDDGRPNGSASMVEVFKDGGMLFDGVCQITIKRLVPRDGMVPKRRNGDDSSD